MDLNQAGGLGGDKIVGLQKHVASAASGGGGRCSGEIQVSRDPRMSFYLGDGDSGVSVGVEKSLE